MELSIYANILEPNKVPTFIEELNFMPLKEHLLFGSAIHPVDILVEILANKSTG